jgi:hypothetical protein
MNVSNGPTGYNQSTQQQYGTGGGPHSGGDGGGDEGETIMKVKHITTVTRTQNDPNQLLTRCVCVLYL